MRVYANTMREAFALEAEGLKGDRIRGQAEWARFIAAEIRKQGMARTKEVIQANGEAVPSGTEGCLHDTLAFPDLAAVEAASFDRTRLLMEQGPDVVVLGCPERSAYRRTAHGPREFGDLCRFQSRGSARHLRQPRTGHCGFGM
jgi:hypothetical protein